MAQIILNHIDIEIWNKRHVQFQPHDDVRHHHGNQRKWKDHIPEESITAFALARNIKITSKYSIYNYGITRDY